MSSTDRATPNKASFSVHSPGSVQSNDAVDAGYLRQKDSELYFSQFLPYSSAGNGSGTGSGGVESVASPPSRRMSLLKAKPRIDVIVSSNKNSTQGSAQSAEVMAKIRQTNLLLKALGGWVAAALG